jgi:hypothetical protein
VVPPNRWAYLAGKQGASMTARIAGQVRVVSAIGLLLPTLVVGPALFAGDGPIPIDQPTVITESGSYVVTADFTASTGSAIKILGDITVDIDFAGHTVSADRAWVISLREYGDEGVPSATLHDGRVVGTVGGVGSVTAFNRPGSNVAIVRMTFENTWAAVQDGRLSVMHSRFINSSMFADANRWYAVGVFENNEVYNGSINALGTTGSVIRGNVLHGGSIYVDGSDGRPSNSDIVEENTLLDGSIRIGQYNASDLVYHIVVKRNAVGGAILVARASEASVVENRVKGCSPRGSGITVTAWGSNLGVFERNVLTGACPYGIEFHDLTRGNLYRDNVAPRATCALVLDNGLDNTDGGGNKPTRSSKKCDASTE